MEQSTASVALCHAQKKTWPKSRKLHSFLISGALLKTHQGKVTAETNKASVMFFVFFFFFFLKEEIMLCGQLEMEQKTLFCLN